MAWGAVGVKMDLHRCELDATTGVVRVSIQWLQLRISVKICESGRFLRMTLLNLCDSASSAPLRKWAELGTLTLGRGYLYSVTCA